MVWALISVPALAGAACFLIRDDRFRRGLLVAAAVLHAGLTAAAWGRPLDLDPTAWVAIGAPALYFLSLTSLLFLLASVYAVGYLALESRGGRARSPSPTGSPATGGGCCTARGRRSSPPACCSSWPR